MRKPMTAEAFAASFWARVDRTGDCWLWTGARSNGYGLVRYQGKQTRTHRVAWILAKGDIPDGRLVCHTCDNPPCCNPLHLFLGSNLDNARDAQRKGRRDRAVGRGHIRAHGDGWRIYAYVGTDPLTGQRRRTSKVVTGSRRDAERALTALLAEVDRNRSRLGTNAMTFGDVIRAFVDHKTLSVEATTADTYRRQLAYIPDRLLDLPVGKIDVETLEALYAHLRRHGHKRTGGPLSVAAVKNVHNVVRGSLELARRRKWIMVNPAIDAEVPTAAARQPSPAPAEKLAELLIAAADQHHALPLYLRLTLAAGARRAEVHGLRWSGVDFATGRVTLRDTIVWAAGQWQVKPRTKTGGQRNVTVGAGTLAQLQALHDRAFTDALTCGAALPQRAFVFTDDPMGEMPWRPATTARRFRRACAAAGLPPTTRLHDLRHLAATHLIDRGLPVRAVSSRLGHTQASTTLNIYTAPVDASDVTAAEMMEELFGDER